MNNHIVHDHSADGIDRRGFLKCMAWAGTGVLWTLSGGVLTSRALGQDARRARDAPAGDFTFVQISDSHIGFNKAAEQGRHGDASGDDRANQRAAAAAGLLLHTGDLTHLAEAGGFDTLDQILKDCARQQVFYVPGEHDVLNDDGASSTCERFGKGTHGSGWYSFDHKGVHFIGLVNVHGRSSRGRPGRAGRGATRLAQERSGAALGASTPIVVFAHVPLWIGLPEVGLGHR